MLQVGPAADASEAMLENRRSAAFPVGSRMSMAAVLGSTDSDDTAKDTEDEVQAQLNMCIQVSPSRL